MSSRPSVAVALGTDRYPPFTLADVPDYPARLDVGQALVKWWLLALPQYLIVAALASLRSVLVLIAGASLLFSARYSESLFELTMAIERWIYRVAVYASLMTDEYPPFQLGADEREVAPAA
jgi:hypothetical protein